MTALASAQWVPTRAEFDAFAGISGDDNPIHVDPAFCARTRFGRPVAHGMLIYAKLWAMARQTHPDTVHRAHTLMFPNPTFVGDRVLLRIDDAGADRLAMRAVRQDDGADLLVGEAGPDAAASEAAPPDDHTERVIGALRVGQSASVRRALARADLDRFAALAGCKAPLDDRVPEPLVAALFSYLLGVKLPGPGTNYLKQELRFGASAPIGEALAARVELTRLRPQKHLADLWARAQRADGTTVCEGRSLVLVRDVGR
ncbi:MULTISPECIES: MaoC/PaaZ C-terminal domain-containing protein [unclassified Roseitalea]|uniref:MaoC/PaaZ C-terminal domain-containing protein n=1 Tax=unclassified Roseitalea TaxID=2639107 RepID=UPI00273FA7CA|nr:MULTISPECIES: MaoC/PaaZ C-terminal domain-containing protein [unclassified Roseitalea]